MSSVTKLKRSHAAYKGHFNITVKSFYALLDVKPRPTKEAVENSYQRVQRRLEALFTSSEKLMSSIDRDGATEGDTESKFDLESVEKYYEETLAEQFKVESRYANFMEIYDRDHEMNRTSMLPRVQRTTKPTIRLTALDPPAWNGIKSDFYTWRRKFTHIMAEVDVTDELTQLCYLQNSKTLPIHYQTFISDCSTMGEAWSRLEERVPKETIKYEIIAQFLVILYHAKSSLSMLTEGYYSAMTIFFK